MLLFIVSCMLPTILYEQCQLYSPLNKVRTGGYGSYPFVRSSTSLFALPSGGVDVDLLGRGEGRVVIYLSMTIDLPPVLPVRVKIAGI